MRINSSTKLSLPRDMAKVSTTADRGFSHQMKLFENAYLKEHMEGELAAIEEQGKNLCRRMNLSELNKFRRMVSEFIRSCIAGGLKLQEERYSPLKGRVKILSVIKTVDEKLLSLAELLMSENKDPLQVLALVDEIRGLLLDLYA